jgi:predicted amidohydrolase YtcJ
VHRNLPQLQAWQPQERITPAEAFRASVRGRVAVGQPADLILLDGDPLEQQPDSAATAARLLAATVSATYVAGERRY